MILNLILLIAIDADYIFFNSFRLLEKSIYFQFHILNIQNFPNCIEIITFILLNLQTEDPNFFIGFKVLPEFANSLLIQLLHH